MAEQVPLHPDIEFTRGMTFYLANFDESTFAASHMHCLNDSKTISDMRGAESEGYVTFRTLHAPDGREGRQYWWVCKDCFHRLQSAMDWKVGVDFPPAPQSTYSWARRREQRSAAELEALIHDHPYALASWGPNEVMGIAASQGLKISLPEAEEILRDNERRIEGAMTAAGFAKIVEILAKFGLSRDKQ